MGQQIVKIMGDILFKLHLAPLLGCYRFLMSFLKFSSLLKLLKLEVVLKMVMFITGCVPLFIALNLLEVGMGSCIDFSNVPILMCISVYYHIDKNV
jgi:hypothetical protein